MISADNFPFLPIEMGNHLVSTESKRTQRKGMDNDYDHYNEVNPNGEVVAMYHVWHHMEIYPPQNVSEGWKKFDLKGNEVAQGTCKTLQGVLMECNAPYPMLKTCALR